MNAHIPADSWRVLKTVRPNVLVIDPDARDCHQLVEAVLEGSRAPIWRCQGSPLELPADGVGTLLLHGVGTLTTDEQKLLLGWIDQNRATQVISVADGPLYPAIAAGTFLDGLYYRLNVLVVERGSA